MWPVVSCRQEAIIKPIYFERASFKVNLDQHVNEKVLVGVSNTFTTDLPQPRPAPAMARKVD